METASASDRAVGLGLLFGAVAVIGSLGMAAYGMAGDQMAAGGSFAVAMIAGSLAVAAYHVYA